MAYKAPLPMRVFHYALWIATLFVLAWFLIPLFLRVTVPRPSGPASLPDQSGQSLEDADTSSAPPPLAAWPASAQIVLA